MFALGAVCTVIACGVLLGARRAAGPVANAVTPLTIRVTVAPGDSLWSLARRYGGPDDYIEDNVDAMAKANGMSQPANLAIGQRLLVTVTNPQELASLQTHLATAR